MHLKTFTKQYANKGGLKTLFYILLAVAMLYFLPKIFKLFKDLIASISSLSGGISSTLEDSIGEDALSGESANEDFQDENDSLNDPDSLSKTIAFYKQIADQQFHAMDGIGTNVTQIKDSLKGLNDNELLEVYKQFGLRLNAIIGTDYHNLMQWYREELSGWSIWGKTEIEQVQEIWSGTGLTI